MQRLKSERIAIILAALLGAVGFLGIGHFYVRKIRRGFILLVGAWILTGASVLLFAAWSMSHMVIPPPGYPKVDPPNYTLIFLAISVALLLGLVALWIWQIFDAKAKCQNYNRPASCPSGRDSGR